MIGLYKDLDTGYRMSAVAGGLLATVLILKDWNLMVVYALIIIWCFLINFMFGKVAAKRINQVIAIMNQHCQAQEFLQQLICLQKHSKGKTMGLFFATNLAAAYLDLGDEDTALYHLQNVNLDAKSQKRNQYLLMVYYNNFATAYMRKENWETADEMLSNMKKIMDHAKLKPAEKQNAERIYQIQCMRMKVLQGNYEGAEEFFLKAIEQSCTLIEQVALTDCLRGIYLQEERWQEAQNCKEFILQNGGDTYYVNSSAMQK